MDSPIVWLDSRRRTSHLADGSNVAHHEPLSYQLMAIWNKKDGAVAIDPSQLTLGLFVWLDVKWSEHPFMSNRMLLKSEDDLAVMRTLDIAGRLYYFPSKSEVPLPPRAQTDAAAAPAASKSAAEKPAVAGEGVPADTKPPARLELSAQQQQIAQLKAERMVRHKQSQVQADRAWESTARTTREALTAVTAAPRAAGKKLDGMSTDMASAVARGKAVMLHLLGTKVGGVQQCHALNTLTLAMMLGKRAGLDETALKDLAMAAVVHDAGKAEIPTRILAVGKRNRYEEDQYRQHLQFSLRFATESGMFSAQALEIIADHHELVDGSGWPKGKRDLSIGARILALVDRYDRLCTPEALDLAPMAPTEALSQLLKRESARYDTALLGFLIKLLGVYPPGTIVQLSDGGLGQVVAPGSQSLKPKVVIFNESSSKEEAHVLELELAGELKVSAALRLDSLPADVLAWFKPDQPQAYFFAVNSD
ncbi:MAG: DUF3391 domain-containing protein [Rhodoferax sp.]|nr:DUF3391 domain-containing protein [Rhodoferax sp.]